jgi:hypothetical protein
MPAIPCAEIGPQLHQNGITVCTAPSLPAGAELGQTDFAVSQGQLSRVRVMLSEASDPGSRDNSVCHEFMHATTGILDNYDTLPDTSCVGKPQCSGLLRCSVRPQGLQETRREAVC